QGNHAPLPRTRVPRKNRPRYSFKRQDRTKMTKRPPPPKMKQFVWKPFKEPDDKPEKPKPRPKPKPALKLLSDSTAATNKLALSRLMNYQHPTANLFVGTLSANIKRVLPGEDSLRDEVMSVCLGAISEAARIKREAQRLIGTYLEHLTKKGLEGLDVEDRVFLDLLCPRVSMGDVKKGAEVVAEDDDDDDDDDDEVFGVVEEGDGEGDDDDGGDDDTDLGGSNGNDNAQRQFLASLLIYLYSGNRPKKAEVARFIDRLEGLHLHELRSQPDIKNIMAFTAVSLLRSITGQLKGELKR
ncbi:hypothetical protein EDD11_000592, partial [Mortierella claussenii]